MNRNDQSKIVPQGFLPVSSSVETLKSNRKKPTGDRASDRALEQIPDLCRKLRIHLGNLGATTTFIDNANLNMIEEFARDRTTKMQPA